MLHDAIPQLFFTFTVLLAVIKLTRFMDTNFHIRLFDFVYLNFVNLYEK